MLPGFLRRARARRRLRDQIAIFYHSSYAPRSLANARVFGLEPLRGELIISDLAEDRLLEPGDIRPSPAATIEELRRFHSLEYIEATARADVLARIFGVEEHTLDSDPVLAAQRRAVGGTLQATKLVYERQRTV